MAGKNKKENKDKTAADTPNKGHKHIFGSSEKSDFILNMTADGAEKLCGRFLIFTMLLVSIVMIPAYFTQHIITYTIDDTPHLLSDNFIFYGAAAVMLMGFLGFLVYSIACNKGIASVRGNKELYLGFGVMIVSAVSALAAAELSTSILGYLGRHEGLLTICACYGLFGVALCISKNGTKEAVSDCIVGIGAVQALVGISQVIPGLQGLTNNFYEYLYLRPGTIPTAEGEVFHEAGYAYVSGIYTDTPAATGFTASPFALAALLTVAFALAAAGAAFGENRVRKLVYTVSSVIITAGACLTRTTAAVAGIAAGGVTVLVMILAGLGEDRKKAAMGLAALGLSLACGLGLFLTGAADTRDEQIIFTDGYVHKSITYAGRRFVNTGEDIFTYLGKDGLNVATQKPLLGVGPDNTVFYFDLYSLSTDRFYNEYADGAASRGFIAEGLFLVFAALAVMKLIRAARRWQTGEGSWIAVGCLTAVVAYLIQAWFNTTWFSSNFLLFIILGLGSDVVIKKKAEKKGRK